MHMKNLHIFKNSCVYNPKSLTDNADKWIKFDTIGPSKWLFLAVLKRSLFQRWQYSSRQLFTEINERVFKLIL